jgi:hypothetical protein
MKEFKLDNHPKISSGFKVPDDYFDKFEEAVQNKIATKETPVFKLFTKKNWIIAVAAIFVIALTIPIFTQITTSSSSIDQAQVEVYLAEQYNLSEDDIVDLLDEEKIEKIELELDINPTELEEALLINSNVEEYFIN